MESFNLVGRYKLSLYQGIGPTYEQATSMILHHRSEYIPKKSLEPQTVGVEDEFHIKKIYNITSGLICLTTGVASPIDV